MNKSMKSINWCESVILTSYDIVKAHGGVPITIGIKVKTNEARPPARLGHSGGDDTVGQGGGLPAGEEGSEFIIELPIMI